MGAKIYISIDDPITLADILQEGRKNGLLKDIPSETISGLLRKDYPIRVPVELDRIMEMVGNPVVRKVFGSKFDKTLSACLQKAMEAG